MKIPRSLLLMMIVEAVAVVVRAWFVLGEHEPESYQIFFMIVSGLSLTAQALAVTGVVELMRRAPSDRIGGLRFVMVGQLVSFALYIGWLAVTYIIVKMDYDFEVYEKYQYLWSVPPIIIGIGLARASRSGGFIAWAITAAVCEAIPQALSSKFYDAIGNSAGNVVFAIVELASLGALVAIVFEVANVARPPAPRAPDADSGLRRASLAHWLQIAAVGLGLLAILFAAGHDPSQSMLRYIEIAAQLAVIGSLAVLAAGLLHAGSSDVADLSPWPLVVAGAVVVWCAGTQLERLQGMIGGESSSELLHAGHVATVLRTSNVLAVMASAVGLFVLGPFGRTRGVAPGIWGFIYAGLAGFALFAMFWLAPDADTEHGATLLALLGSASLVGANAVAAIGFARGADIADAPALPVASLRPTSSPP